MNMVMLTLKDTYYTLMNKKQLVFSHLNCNMNLIAMVRLFMDWHPIMFCKFGNSCNSERAAQKPISLIATGICLGKYCY
jgi:hypothetical protein